MSKNTAFDQREFRNALSCFATGVTVVTTLDPKGEALGITANSFTAVSLDPPLILWCVSRHGSSFPVFDKCESFTVSVLSEAASDVSKRHAAKDGHRVDLKGTVPTKIGPPAFPGALAVFECNVHGRHDGGDHVILVGLVKNFVYVRDSESGDKPLVFYRGNYGTIIGAK